MEIYNVGGVTDSQGSDHSITVIHSGGVLAEGQKVLISGSGRLGIDGCHTVIRPLKRQRKPQAGVHPKDWGPAEGFIMARPTGAKTSGGKAGTVYGKLEVGAPQCGGVINGENGATQAGFDLGKYGIYIIIGIALVGFLWYKGYFKKLLK
jgi:hypothetical protein